MVTCPRCGRENPEDFSFCGYCRAELRPGASDSVPEERRVVTALFCDLVEFTASSQNADPEDVRARVAPYFARLRSAAGAYGGTLEKYIGDAILAVFGTPHAHEDDPERAVRAGLLILREIHDLNAADPSLKLRVRIGIHTGEVLARLTPYHDQSQGMITGPAVNMASRLQNAAAEDSIVVSEATYLATREVFDYEALPKATLKGITDPVAIWRPTASRAPLGVDITRTHTGPLFGRADDIELLMLTFARALRDRSVHTTTIVGEPGIGKTRLVIELNRRLDAQHDLMVRWRQGRCLPYGEGITFWALGEIVKAEARIYESDDPETAESKLASIVPEDDDAPWLLRRLRPLVGLPAPEATPEENFTSWRRFLEHLAEERPSVFVFEDLHWADDAMLAFLEHLAEYAGEVPMLVVNTARPELYERKPGWLGGIRNAATIDLAALSDDETAELASELLGRAVLPTDARALIASRSGGNPLYAEEFVGLLTERGILREEGDAWHLNAGDAIPLPSGIRALIAARLDTLPAERKAMLADASVLGEAFWSGAVAEMERIDPQLVERALHELSRKELVRKSRGSTIQGESEYRFWHALVRDVAYAQIPRAARAEKHLAAAAWVERVATDRVADVSEALANHYTSAMELFRAGGRMDDARSVEPSALRYLTLAGDRGMGLNVARAQAHFRRALELAPEGHPQRPRILGRLGEAAQISGDLVEAAAFYEEAISGHEALGDTDEAADLSLRYALVLDGRGEVSRARALVDAVIAECEPRGPSPELARAYAEKAYPGWGIPYPEAISWADRALDMAERFGLPAVRARALDFRGGARVGMGDPGGLDDLRAALAVTTELGLARQTYVTYFNLVANLGYEDPVEALRVAQEGLRFVADRGLREGEGWIRAHRLQSMFQLGHWKELIRDADEIAAWAGPLGNTWLTVSASYLKSWVLSFTGATTEAVDLAASFRDDARRQRMIAQSDVPMVRGLRARGDDESASEHLLGVVVALENEPGTCLEAVAIAAREAAALGHRDVLVRLETLCQGELAIVRNARWSVGGLLAELDGDVAVALKAFVHAEEGWEGFGNPYEAAHARFGRGRCLWAMGQEPEAQAAVRVARDAFARLEAEPDVASVDAMLPETG